MSVDSTRLGYGASRLMGTIDWKTSVDLVRLAVDQGIRYFDTAPMYSDGLSEQALGEALIGLRSKVMIATKVGIEPGRRSIVKTLVRQVATKAFQIAPVIRDVARRKVAPQASSAPPQTNFGLDVVERSVERSLKSLRTDYVDVLLLHEARLEDMNDALIQKLESLKTQGKIRSFGIGSARREIEKIVEAGRPAGDVLQFEMDLMSPPWRHEWPTINTHGAMTRGLSLVRQRLQANPDLIKLWSAGLEVDLHSPQAIPSLLLQAALLENKAGHILLSTKRKSALMENLAAVRSFDETRTRRFLELFRNGENP